MLSFFLNNENFKCTRCLEQNHITSVVFLKPKIYRKFMSWGFTTERRKALSEYLNL